VGGERNMALLDFLGPLEHSGLYDFWQIRDHDIPPLPGAYILVGRGNSHFAYPNGNNPIFYIGQSKNLRARLREHLKYALQARDDRKEYLYWPRYEFAAVYGGRYCFVRTWQGMKPKALEEELLARFARKHRSFPIANGSGSWNRISEIIEGA
jgi:hypothetical protein